MVGGAIIRHMKCRLSERCSRRGPCGLPRSVGPARTDQPPLTFRAEANFVEVDAIVSDANGQPGAGPARRRLPAARGRQAADGKRVLVREHSRRASGTSVVSPAAIQPTSIPMIGHGRAYLPPRARRPARRPRRADPAVKRRCIAFFERNFGANDVAGGRLYGRPFPGRPGVHEQPEAAARRGGQVHGTKAALADARAA